MAYDLILRRTIPRNYARGHDLRPTPVAIGLGVFSLLIASSLVVVPGILRQREIRRYQRELDDGSSVTREMPAVTMEDLIYGDGVRP